MATITIEKRKRITTNELEGIKVLLGKYPSGILSMVSDTYDLWRMCIEYLPALKEQILGRDGKLVIRPDSGDPVDIICGGFHFDKAGEDFIEFESKRFPGVRNEKYDSSNSSHKGVIELLWDTFGGTIVKGADGKDYKVLDSHIGAIYGDSITLERATQICERLKTKGFASTNVVLGIGSFTYQYNTRDTFGFAVKATYGELFYPDSYMGNGPCTITESREIWKDPITDDGTKKSLKGLISVQTNILGDLIAKDQQTWEQEATGLLQTVYLDGKITKEYTLEEIRKRIKEA